LEGDVGRPVGERKRTWIASVLTVLIALSALAGILSLRQRAEIKGEAQVVLASMEASGSHQTVETLSLIGLTLASGDGPNAAIGLQLAASRDELRQLRQVSAAGARRLAELGIRDPHAESAGVELDRLETALLISLDLIEAGRYDEAYIYGQQRIKPAFERSEKQIALATSAFEEEAQRARRLQSAGGAVTLLAAFALIFTLHHRLDRVRRLLQQELHHEALHDPLTNLPNRRLFTDRLETACRQRTRSGQTALIYIDLDGFKEINDTLGHDSGDVVLCAVAARLETCLREGDTVARLGGDEFAVLLPNVETALEAMGLADRVLSALERPFEAFGSAASVGASVGIALLDGASESADELSARADAAMYEVKRSGKGGYRIAPPKTDPKLRLVGRAPQSPLPQDVTSAQ
jgi:diguanylate cyclase (GGDEF)-like protein